MLYYINIGGVMSRQEPKEQTAFRLSKKAKTLLKAIAEEDGIAMTSVIENAIRQIASERNINYEDIKDAD